MPLQNDGKPHLGRKVVAEKREPVYLIAIDKSECMVSRERFADAQVGKAATCMWQSRVGAGF